MFTVVTTYFPSGETCDMKPTRFRPTCRSCEGFHVTMSLVLMVICGLTGTMA